MMITVGKLSYCCERVIGQGTFSTVFAGLFEECKPVAIKRIQKSYDVKSESQLKREIELMLKMNDHPNILRLFCCEMTVDFIFIGTELCAATLQELIEGKYQGPKFENEIDILHQMTEGITHLHGLNFVHRDIKPTNILVFLPENYDNDNRTIKPEIKLADFGLCRILKANQSVYTNTSTRRPSDSEGWTAPELYESIRYDFQVDIFSLGCIFGYVLSDGKHPFGDHPLKRSVWIMEKKPLLMVLKDLKRPYSNDSLAYELIQSMVDMNPRRRPTAVQVLNHSFFEANYISYLKQKEPLHHDDSGNVEAMESQGVIAGVLENKEYGSISSEKTAVDPQSTDAPSPKMVKVSENLSYDPQNLIGRGAFSNVYRGRYKNESVAVKRFQKSDTGDDRVIKREETILIRLKDSQHVLRYICMETNDDFLFIATELASATLEDLIEGRCDGQLIQDEKEILHQVTQGLDYLHRNSIVHRDVKPTNILIFAKQQDKPSLIKLADFGLSKILLRPDNDDFSNTDCASPKGTRGWMAPEMYHLTRYDLKVDIFALGCLFYYTLSGGKHPFGNDPIDRMYRIKRKEPKVLELDDFKDPYCKDTAVLKLISTMVEMEPSNRPTVDCILNDPFFHTLKISFSSERSTTLLNFCRYNIYELEDDKARDQFIQLAKDEAVDVNIKTVDGWTPLHFLCRFYKSDNLVECVQLLIERGADVNAKTSLGWNSLHLLCENYEHDNLFELVKLLTDKGIDLEAKTNKGYTASSILQSRSREGKKMVRVPEVLKFLT